jgi:hypothetical protein
VKIQLKRSNVLDGGVAKAPTPEQMEYGELAVNYAASDATIFLKNSDNQVISFYPSVKGQYVQSDGGNDITGDISNTSTGYFQVSSGSTSQRIVPSANGMIRYNTDFNEYEGYASTGWAPLGGGGATVSQVVPDTNVKNGDLWWDSTDGRLYIYYQDADSSQWVDASPDANIAVQSGPNPPANAVVNDLWFNTNTGLLYIYYQDADSVQWVDTAAGGAGDGGGGGTTTGGGTDLVFQENTMVCGSDFTLTTGRSALSAGPITIEDGVVITIPDNQSWVIL